MARFRLLSAHDLNTSRGPVYCEPGAEISSGDFINFRCTALMEALDPEAAELLRIECDRLRSPSAGNPGGCVIGIGPIVSLPA